jgi:hypothetical protein
VSVDNLKEVINHVLVEVRMERLNLNVREETRKSLKRLAKGAKVTEAEYARQLLEKSVREAERDELARQWKAAMTPELRKQLREVGEFMEKLRGPTR